MIEKILKDKRMLSLYIVVIFSLTLGFTYALGTYSKGISISTALIGVDDRVYGSTTFDSSDLDFKPILDTGVETSLDNVIKIDFSVGGASTNTVDNIIYDIALTNLEVNCELLSPYIKWKLIKDGAELTSGSLDYKFDTIIDGRLVLTDIQFDLPDYSENKSGYHNYTFYMWMSDSCQDSKIEHCVTNAAILDQSFLNGKYFSGKIEVELYTESKKQLVRNPSNSLISSTCRSDYPLMVNKPNLDNGNLLPVYYDEINEKWRKADSNNRNYSWYNYETKKWANAVIIGDEAKKIEYQEATPGTNINEQDITAFYVWIPRYKYRVWNITRQGGNESTYAYKAFSRGIDIVFENGTESTGNITCTYNTATVELETNLSDSCKYNGSSTAITTSDSNKDYINAWYTHPAFTFGTDANKEKTGIWVGKFETGNTVNAPKIIPDVTSLKTQNLSTQFTVSKKFQNYISNNLDAHIITNLEWGAVTYFMHSIYGLCDGNTCKGMNINNSKNSYTGRSGGAVAGSSSLSLSKVYPNESSDTTMYNEKGYYTYKGYFMDYSGNITDRKDITKISSTNGNITGIYDMNGGSYEYVMANMVDESNQFNLASAGNNWNGSDTLDSKYYNSYSYGTKYNNISAFNRARLGDATAETLGSNISATGGWKVGSGITGASSYFLNSTSPWYDRGGYSNTDLSSPFFYSRNNGGSYLAFRSVIS